MFRCLAERSHVVESVKPGKPPPAEPREARREGAGGAQRRATRSAAGWRAPSPLTQNLQGNTALPPKDLPRNASCPPRGRGNERFLLSFIGRTRSAPVSEHSARNIEFRSSSRRLFRDYLTGTKIISSSNPRGCRAIASHYAIRARYSN